MALFKGTLDDFYGDYRQRSKNLNLQYGTATISRDTLYNVFADVAMMN